MACDDCLRLRSRQATRARWSDFHHLPRYMPPCLVVWMHWRAQEMMPSSSGYNVQLLVLVSLICSFLIGVFHFCGTSQRIQEQTNSNAIKNKGHQTVPLIVFKLPRTGSSWFNQELNRYRNHPSIVVKNFNPRYRSSVCLSHCYSFVLISRSSSMIFEQIAWLTPTNRCISMNSI
jgi:hypothetical protein